MGEGRCLALDCSEKAKDQAIRVLQHFNIQPTKSDIFSRCQVRSSLCVCVCVCVGLVQRPSVPDSHFPMSVCECGNVVQCAQQPGW